MSGRPPRGWSARQLKDGAVSEAGKSITLAAAVYAALPAFGMAAAGVGAAFSVADIAAKVARERDKLERERRTNKFLFLPEAERRLGKS